MTHETSANAYLRTKVMTASPEQLRLMLLDGAVKFATQGRDGLLNNDYESIHSGFAQCRNILIELINTIKPEYDPELAEQVRALYAFLYSELVDASMEKDPDKADKIIALLEYERETWQLLIDQLAEERHTEVAAANTQGVAPEAVDLPDTGSISSFNFQA